MIVTIAGPPSSGKSTLARALAERLGPTACVVPDLFEAFVAREQRAPTRREARRLWSTQVSVNSLLASQFATVLCAGAPWATCAYAVARGAAHYHNSHTIDATRVAGYYDAAILLTPLPWSSSPGRVEEPTIDREAMVDFMARALDCAGIPTIVIRTVDGAQRVSSAIGWLRSVLMLPGPASR